MVQMILILGRVPGLLGFNIMPMMVVMEFFSPIILSIVILGGLLLKLLVREIFFSRLLSSSVSHSSLEQFE